jgi:hypothetical protein
LTRVRIYTLQPEPMAQLKRWLEETEQLWSEQLLAFKQRLEVGPTRDFRPNRIRPG